MSSIIVLDNGASTIKSGVVGSGSNPRCVTSQHMVQNCGTDLMPTIESTLKDHPERNCAFQRGQNNIFWPRG